MVLFCWDERADYFISVLLKLLLVELSLLIQRGGGEDIVFLRIDIIMYQTFCKQADGQDDRTPNIRSFF